MTSKERIHAVLNRQPVDRLPVDIWHTGEVFQSLAEYTGLHEEKEIYRQLGLDKIIWFGPTYKGPIRPKGSEEETTNYWGIRFRAIQAGQAEYSEFLENPLASYKTPESLEDYPWWPDPEQFDYEAMIRDAERGGTDFAVMGPWVSFFEIYCWMRGLENSMMDVVLNPDLVEAALDRIEAIQTEMLHRFLIRAKDKVSLVFISDDMGGQNGLLISIKMWKQFIGPRLKRWCDLVHTYGVKVFYHSDGSIEPLIPHLIEAGIDVLNPIQHVCSGMEMAPLKQKYGHRLIFHGGVDNQSALPFGTPDQVRAETETCIEALGPDGFICCSCHNVQAGTPVENILAMIQTVHQTHRRMAPSP